jgi:hypothetical protein
MRRTPAPRFDLHKNGKVVAVASSAHDFTLAEQALTQGVIGVAVWGLTVKGRGCIQGTLQNDVAGFNPVARYPQTFAGFAPEIGPG